MVPDVECSEWCGIRCGEMPQAPSRAKRFRAWDSVQRPRNRGAASTAQSEKAAGSSRKSATARKTAVRPATVCSSGCFRNEGGSVTPGGGAGFCRSCGNWSAVTRTEPNAATAHTAAGGDGSARGEEGFTRAESFHGVATTAGRGAAARGALSRAGRRPQDGAIRTGIVRACQHRLPPPRGRPRRRGRPIALASRAGFWFYPPACDRRAALSARRPRPRPFPLTRPSGMSDAPMQMLALAMRQHGLVRFVEHFAEQFPGCHLKDLVVDAVGPDRTMVVGGHTVVNFGSDSFLGLDQDPRVQDAVVRGVRRWGSHNGASRAFSCVRANDEAEAKLAAWLGTEEVLIYPSVSLANLGAVPGLVGRRDLLVVDEHAHNSIHEGTRIARANGTRVLSFSHCDPVDLARVLAAAGDYRVAVVLLDGVYSMTGELPPLADLDRVARRQR